MDEAADAIDDSDEEADYTKMDMGNKKGPVNRWDFENDEQYQEYMSKKEALPKWVVDQFIDCLASNTKVGVSKPDIHNR